MSAIASEQRQLLMAELDAVPVEYYPFVLQMIRQYRESVMLQPAGESFRRGWKEVCEGQVHPIDQLWEGIDAE